MWSNVPLFHTETRHGMCDSSFLQTKNTSRISSASYIQNCRFPICQQTTVKAGAKLQSPDPKFYVLSPKLPSGLQKTNY